MPKNKPLPPRDGQRVRLVLAFDLTVQSAARLVQLAEDATRQEWDASETSDRAQVQGALNTLVANVHEDAPTAIYSLLMHALYGGMPDNPGFVVNEHNYSAVRE